MRREFGSQTSEADEAVEVPNPPPIQLYNENEAAEFLRCSVRTLQYWRYVGGGPVFVKVGRRVLYRQQDLDAFIVAGLRSSTSDTAAPR